MSLSLNPESLAAKPQSSALRRRAILLTIRYVYFDDRGGRLKMTS
jgi:hypothetical protein